MATVDSLEKEIDHLQSAKNKCKDDNKISKEQRNVTLEDINNRLLKARRKLNLLTQQPITGEPPRKRQKESSLANLPHPNASNNTNDSNEIDDMIIDADAQSQ